VRALIVDDEELARQRLKRLLRAFPEVEVVGEAADGEEALAKIAELRPDLVFLDIQMPGCNGMEVALSLPSPAPKIIFCTAYDEYAIEAFEVNAADYVLKPASRARLGKALERVRSRGAAEMPDLRMTGAPRRFLGKRGNRYRVIPIEEVLFFTSEEGLTRLHTAEKAFWMEPSLSDLEDRLGSGDFCRVSRRALVRLEAVTEVVPLIGGNGQVRMSNGETLAVSRRRMKELLHRLES
jgi:two-component system LytT family response regulator